MHDQIKPSVHPNPGFFLRLGDIFFVLRPTLWFPVWTMILCGTGGSFAGGGEQHSLVLIVALTLLMAVVYLLNQIKDAEGDRINNKLHYLALGILSRKAAWCFAMVLLLSGMILLIVGGNSHLLVLVLLIMLLTAVLYNFSHHAMKDSLWGSLLVTFIGGWFLVLIGRSLGGKELIHPLLPSLAYALAFTATGILTMIPDVTGDRQTGKKTIAVMCGRRVAASFALGFVITAAIISIFVREWILFWPSVLSIPLFILTVIKNRRFWVFISIKFTILALSVFAGLFYYPHYLLIILVYYILARIYYRKRFGIHYPSFGGEFA